ncbi:uncharacterized protein LOC132558053 [Ylistrum balloti]|uniref:uncharacterized protein LOC132558053 n=1 Tax=Ylistrum balloti TaxID=509963 RepID=UPI002905876C|nr:uncharacterized protein LOC132558053 [Ylistrum balloti]
MAILLCTFLWTIGFHAVSTQYNLYIRHRQQLPPLAPLVSMSRNDLSNYKHRTPSVNIPGPKDTGPKNSGPADKNTFPGSGGVVPASTDELIRSIGAILGFRNPAKGPMNLKPAKHPSIPKDPVNEPTKPTTKIPETTTMLYGCPEYNSTYRRDRLVIFYQDDKCEMELRLKRHRKTSSEYMSIRYKKVRSRTSKQNPNTPDQIVCEKFPHTEERGITFITTRPQQCKLEITVELAAMPTTKTSRKNKRGKRLLRRPVYTAITL